MSFFRDPHVDDNRGLRASLGPSCSFNLGAGLDLAATIRLLAVQDLKSHHAWDLLSRYVMRLAMQAREKGSEVFLLAGARDA